MTSSPLLNALRQAVGGDHVRTREDGHDLGAWEQDWRKRARGHAMAVVLPASTAEVADVVRACSVHGTSIVPQGGNTGLVIGSIPDDSGQQVVLNLTRLRRVRALDPHNLTLTAEAGCVLQTLQETAARAGLLLPLSLAAEGSCTLGGNLATNAGGTQVLRYGNARELCLGLEVVTARGEIWHGLKGLRKDNTGYDLRDLFIGSEGTLGIITAATMRLHPQPLARLTAWAQVPCLEAAVALLGMTQRHLGPGLTGFEVMGHFAVGLVVRHMPQLKVPLWHETPRAKAPGFFVLLEISDSESETHARARFEALMQAALEAALVHDAVIAESLSQARHLWHVRESIPLAQAEEGLNIKHDISLPISRIPAFCSETDALLQQVLPGVRLVNFGHLGDGNLHYNVQAPVEGDPAEFLRTEETRVNTLVFDQVQRHGGSISAEHGIGGLKAHALPHYQDPVAMALMRQIKRALDPQGLFNPGRVLTTIPD